MKQLGKILCILALSLSFVTPVSAGEVWIITSLDWQPYSDSNMPSQGNSIQKLRTILRQEDIKLIVEFYPWARAQEMAKQEGYVGYFPAWPEEVAEGFIASPPVDWSEVGVLTYKNSGLKWTDIETLFNDKVGLVSTYIYPEEIVRQADARPENVDPTPNEVALMKKLSAKRFKAAVTDPTVMLYLAEREGISNIKLLKTIGKKELVIAFRNTPKNLERLNLLVRLLNK